MKQSDVDQRRLPWIKLNNPTKAFYPLCPEPEEVDIQNIAWALSMQCRFNGHVNFFYSVAQHSIVVSNIVEAEHPFDNKLILRALMHDAHEAYIGDIITPIKKELPQIEKMEKRLDRAICKKFNMELEMAPCIKEADRIALMTEARDLQNTSFLDECFNDVKPLDYHIKPLSQPEAYDQFIKRFYNLQDRIFFVKEREQKEKAAKKKKVRA